MKCPNCGLHNPPSALRCDCDYDFEKQTVESAKKTNLSKSRSSSWMEEVEGLCFLLSISPFFAAVGVLVYQCFLWLMYGEWIEVSGSVVFEYVLGPDHPFLQWLNDPQSWQGLQRIVQILTGSLSFSLFLIGIATVYLFSILEVGSGPKTRD